MFPLLFLLLGTPQAEAQASRDFFHDALLLEVADGDWNTAALTYTQLSRSLPTTDPTRAEALYRLALLRYMTGDVVSARSALREGIRTQPGRDRFLDLLGQIELDQNSITSLPSHYSFEDTHHGVHHPWKLSELGTLRVEVNPTSNNAFLAWETLAQSQALDELVVGFNNVSPPPKTISFSAWIGGESAYLRIVIEDIDGEKYVDPTHEFVLVSSATPEIIRLDVAHLRPVREEAPPLIPKHIARMTILDVTYYQSQKLTRHIIYVDDLRAE